MVSVFKWQRNSRSRLAKGVGDAESRGSKGWEIYVGLGLMEFHTEEELRSENKFVLIGPDGSVLTDFLKRTRPPEAELRPQAAGRFIL